MNSNIKRQQMDDSKNEYANQLQKTNELQVGGFPLMLAKQSSEVVSGDLGHVRMPTWRWFAESRLAAGALTSLRNILSIVYLVKKLYHLNQQT